MNGEIILSDLTYTTSIMDLVVLEMRVGEVIFCDRPWTLNMWIRFLVGVVRLEREWSRFMSPRT